MNVKRRCARVQQASLCVRDLIRNRGPEERPWGPERPGLTGCLPAAVPRATPPRFASPPLPLQIIATLDPTRPNPGTNARAAAFYTRAGCTPMHRLVGRNFKSTRFRPQETNRSDRVYICSFIDGTPIFRRFFARDNRFISFSLCILINK